MADSFVFYRSFYDAMTMLDVYQLQEAFDAVMRYAFDGEEPEELSTPVSMVFTLIKPQIDANMKRARNGRLGGRPKAEEKPMVSEIKTNGSETENHRLSNEKPNCNVNDNVNVNVNIKDKGVNPQTILDMFNSICVSFPKCTKLSESRRKAIHARLTQYTVDDFETLFKKAEQSAFLKGSNSRDWRATFDWLIKDQNMAKVLDGNYDSAKKKNPFTNMPSNTYDFDALEKQLVCN